MGRLNRSQVQKKGEGSLKIASGDIAIPIGLLDFSTVRKAGERYLYISWINTNSDEKRKGVRRALMQRFMREVVQEKNSDIKTVKLSVLNGRQNIPAMTLYKNMGFKWVDSGNTMSLNVDNYKGYKHPSYFPATDEKQ